MGNYASCCAIKRSSKSAIAKLMDSQGNLKQVSLPIKAAELMLEEPGYVISPVEELLRSGRVIAMRADDELWAGKLYLLSPLSRVHTRVSELERGILESVATACDEKRYSGKKRRVAKVLPTAAVELREDGVGDGDKGGNDAGFGCYRSGNCRQWTPVLEPISEE